MASQLTATEAHERLALVRSLRSMRSDLLYILVRAAAEHQPVGYQKLFQLTIAAGASTRDGKPLANASYYHVLTAAKTLNLVGQSTSSKNYHLTELGADYLCQIDRFKAPDDDFQRRLLSVTANLVSVCPNINNAFFWLFRGTDLSYPLHKGRPVNLAPTSIPADKQSVAIPKSRRMAWRLTSTFCEQPLVLNTVETQSIVLGLRQWCLELGLLDELIDLVVGKEEREESREDAKALRGTKGRMVNGQLLIVNC